MGRGLGSLQLPSCNNGGREKASGLRRNEGLVRGQSSHLTRRFKPDSMKSLSEDGKLIVQWKRGGGGAQELMWPGSMVKVLVF